MGNKYPNIPSSFTKDEYIKHDKPMIIYASPAMIEAIERAIDDELRAVTGLPPRAFGNDTAK